MYHYLKCIVIPIMGSSTNATTELAFQPNEASIYNAKIKLNSSNPVVEMTTKNNKTRTLRVSSNVKVSLHGVLITRFTDDEFGHIRRLFATGLNDREQVLLSKLVSTNILALLFKVYE